MPEPNVYFLYGNDEYAIARRLAQLRADFPDATAAEMNTSRLEARTMSEDELNNAVNAAPFLAARRLVLLAEPSARYTTPEARKKFCAFLEKVPPTTRLVMHEWMETKTYRDKSREAKEDEKHWLVKWGRQAGIGLERHALPAAWEMTGWIIHAAKEQGEALSSSKGEAIEPAAAARLAEMVGVDTRQAAQEIGKLLAYVNWARPITLRDVEAVSVVTNEPDIFAMVDALANGNGSTAQRLLRRLLEQQDPFQVWGMVIRQFRLLMLAREVLDAGGSKSEVEKTLGIHPFVAEKVTTQARRFAMPALEALYHQLLGIDEGVKIGQVTLDTALDMLVVELT